MTEHEFVACPDENSFHQLWQQRGLAERSASALAYAGGAIADRPAWVFIAGYQAALRQGFPVFAQQARGAACWGSYLVSEQRDESKAPTCTVATTQTGVTLNGTKSWLASAQHLDWLIVKAQQGPQTHHLLVPATGDGVDIILRDSGKFLPEMSVAGARFAATPVAASADLDASEHHADKFVFIESRCLMIALCGHFAALAQHQGRDANGLEQARLIVEGLVTAELDQAESLRGLLAGMNQLRAWFDEWLAAGPGAQAEPQTDQLYANWAANQRLVDMHRGFLERRLA